MRRIIAAATAALCILSLTACTGEIKTPSNTTGVFSGSPVYGTTFVPGETSASTSPAAETSESGVYTTLASLPSDRTTSAEEGDSHMEITSEMAKAFKHGEVDVEDAELPSKDHKPANSRIVISCIGDVMAHDTTFKAAWNGSAYDFDYMMEEVAPFVESSDYMIANLETTLAGKDRGYSGYPDFNTPEQIADSLRDVLGVDLVSTANNHSNDRGFSGLCNTLDYLDRLGILHCGTYASEEDSTKPLVTEINGVKFGFINYTYGLNNIDGVKNRWSINVIDKDKIAKMASACTDAGAEYVIALMHWGVEYSRATSADQRSLAEWIFANTDVRLIIGAHPHVVQPIDEITVERNGEEKKGIVLYSLGNFSGSMSKEWTDTGLLAEITLNLTPENVNSSAVESIVCTPLYVDGTPGGSRQFRVISIGKGLSDYQSGSDSLLSSDDNARMKHYMDDYREMLETLDCITVQ